MTLGSVSLGYLFRYCLAHDKFHDEWSYPGVTIEIYLIKGGHLHCFSEEFLRLRIDPLLLSSVISERQDGMSCCLIELVMQQPRLTQEGVSIGCQQGHTQFIPEDGSFNVLKSAKQSNE